MHFKNYMAGTEVRAASGVRQCSGLRLWPAVHAPCLRDLVRLHHCAGQWTRLAQDGPEVLLRYVLTSLQHAFDQALHAQSRVLQGQIAE